MYRFLHCTIFIAGVISITGRHFVVCLFSCITFVAALSRANHGRLPPLLSPLGRCTECGASSRPALTDPVQGLLGRGDLQRHPLMTPENKNKNKKITFSELVGVLHVPQCQYGHVKYRFTGHAGAPTFYLSSDSAGEPPHGFIGGVVFTSTPHLKGKRHSVSFNLQQGTGEKRELSTPVCAKCSLFLFVQNNLFLP